MNDERRPEPGLECWFAERAAGLAEPQAGFEEMLVMASATPQQRKRWWPFTVGTSMSGPARERPLVLVSAVIAILLAVLAVGFLTSELMGERMQPAPPAVEPETEAVGARLDTFGAVMAQVATEQQEPGVEAVVSDGAGHDLSGVLDMRIGRDGRVWAMKDDQIIELGQAGSTPLAPLGPVPKWGAIGTGWDGQVLLDRARSIPEDEHHPDAVALAATSDDRVWGRVGELPVHPAYHDGSRWVRVTPAEMGLAPELEWMMLDLQTAPDGSVWVSLYARERQAGQLAHHVVVVSYDGDAWQTEFEPAGVGLERPLNGALVRPGVDGSIWLLLTEPLDPSKDVQHARLARRVGGSWEIIGVPATPDDLVIGPDGTAWLTVDEGPTAYRFDDPGWTSVPLPGSGEDWTARPLTLQVAPDGKLWVLGWTGPGDALQARIFDPEVLAE